MESYLEKFMNKYAMIVPPNDRIFAQKVISFLYKEGYRWSNSYNETNFGLGQAYCSNYSGQGIIDYSYSREYIYQIKNIFNGIFEPEQFELFKKAIKGKLKQPKWKKIWRDS